MDNWIPLIAQQATPAAPGGAGQPPQQEGIFGMMAPLLMIVVLGYFLLWRPEKRRQQALKAQIDAIKKNDRVVTIGGIYGIVTNVNREADRVSLRVDESNNVKIDVTPASIARVVNDQSSGDKPA